MASSPPQATRRRWGRRSGLWGHRHSVIVRRYMEQLVEIGYGLMAAGFPFLWVARGVESGGSPEVMLIQKWLGEEIVGRGLIVRGWAPQMVILGHEAVGGFATHYGWNSVIEGMAAGVLMVTWPFASDQFLNERLVVAVVAVVGVGVGVGAMEPAKWEENRMVHGGMVSREAIEKAVREVIEGEKRRERAALIKEKAQKAMQIGGSSHENINRFRLAQLCHQKILLLNFVLCLENSAVRGIWCHKRDQTKPEFVVQASRNSNFLLGEVIDEKEIH